jgi:hypothetical protein
VKTKTHEEVTEDFVKAASYILSAALTADGKPAAKIQRGAPLWDSAQFAEGQYCSQTTYYHVTGIDGDRITVVNQYGNTMYVSRDIIEKMTSGVHFEH